MSVPGRLLFHDDFTAADSTAASSVKWSTVGLVNATADTQSNQLRLALAGTAGAYAENVTVVANTTLPSPNFELTSDVIPSATTEYYPSIGFGAGVAATDTPQQNGYCIIFSPAITTVELARYDGNTKTTLVSDAAFTYTGGTAVHVRWRVEQETHLVRVWQGTADEPTGWKWAVKDGTYLGYQNLRLGVANLCGAVGAAKYAAFDFVTIYELAQGRRRRAGVR